MRTAVHPRAAPRTSTSTLKACVTTASRKGDVSELRFKSYHPQRPPPREHRVTCTHLDVPADDPAHAVGCDAPVDGAVDVLAVGGGGEGQKDQSAVAEHPPDAGDVAHRGAVHREPIDRRLRAAGSRTVQPAAAGVGEFQSCGWLHHESGTAEVQVESRHRQPCNGRETVVYLLGSFAFLKRAAPF